MERAYVVYPALAAIVAALAILIPVAQVANGAWIVPDLAPDVAFVSGVR